LTPALTVRPDESTRSNWADPGVWEVAPGIYRVPLPLPNDGLRAVNVYVIANGSDTVFIDSGWAIDEARELIGQAVAALDLSLTDVSRFLVTHVHRDHYSQAITLRNEFGGDVSLGEGDRASLDLMMTPRRHPLTGRISFINTHGAPDLGRRLAEHYAAEVSVPPPGTEYPDTWLHGGEEVPAGDLVLDVVSTPGHTNGHLVFHATKDRMLFAGDHVLPNITPSIGFEPAPVADPLGAFLGSLAAVRARPDSRLFPAHGPVTESTHARIDELVEHHGRRLDQAEAAVRGGAHTSYEVAGQLRWTRHEHKLSDLDLFNEMLAVSETAAHLNLLVSQGRLTETEVHEVRTYLAP
jgi:glyoxylase-like metal-dependent hydrolase (beta-lactamase superfamily II)